MFTASKKIEQIRPQIAQIDNNQVSLLSLKIDPEKRKKGRIRARNENPDFSCKKRKNAS